MSFQNVPMLVRLHGIDAGWVTLLPMLRLFLASIKVKLCVDCGSSPCVLSYQVGQIMFKIITTYTFTIFWSYEL